VVFLTNMIMNLGRPYNAGNPLTSRKHPESFCSMGLRQSAVIFCNTRRDVPLLPDMS